MKSFYTLVVIAGVLLSLNSYGQMSGTYTVNGTTGPGNFVNLTGPAASAGTIKILVATPTVVTGTGTAFTAAWVGAKLYTSSAGLVSTYIGTIASYTNGTSVTLSAPYSAGLAAGTVFCGPDAPGAFAALNANTSAGVTLSISANLTGTHTEPGTTALTNIGSVTIINGGGSVIEGANVAGNASGMIRLSGCSSITIGQASNTLTFRNDYTTSGADLVFLNGSSSNLVQYCTFENENTSVLSTALGGAISFATDAAGAGCGCGNSSNTIDHCTIRDRTDLGSSPPLAHNGIVSKGTAGYLNNSNTISNCNFDNIEDYGVWVDATGNGDSWNITNNDFYWDKTTTSGSTAQSAVYFNAGVANANYVSITNNYIGGNAVWASRTGYWPNTLAAGSFIGIYVLVGPSGSATVTGNTIGYINLTGATSATLTGIQAAGGIFSITGNTIGDASGSNSIESSSAAATIAGILLTATTAAAPNSTADVETNNINALTSTGAGICNVYGISNTGTGFVNNVTISNNSINTLKAAGTTGILAGINNTANVLLDFETNTITKLTYNGTSTGTTSGIYITAGQGSGSVGSQGAPLIYNNTINTITNSGSGANACIVAGIYNKATNIDIYANFINTLKNTNASSATGSILAGIDNAVATGLSMDNNTIYTMNLSGLGTTAGIYSVLGTNPQIYSNTINDLHNLLTTTAGINNIAGIYTTTTGSGTTDIEYNNIHNVTNVNTLSTGVTSGIENVAGAVTNLTMSNNTIDTIAFSGTGSIAGIYNTGTSVLDIESNTIDILNNSGTGTLAGIDLTGGTGSGTVGTAPLIYGNTIYGFHNKLTATAGVNTLAGIIASGGTNLDIESNNIHGFTNTNTLATGVTGGIQITGGTNPTIRSNSLDTFSLAGTAAGILAGIYSTPATTLDMESNGIATFNYTGLGTLGGIYFTAGTTPKLLSNTIDDFHNTLTASAGVCTVAGIYNTGATTTNADIESNIIDNITNTNASATGLCSGISTTSAGVNVKILSNQVYTVTYAGSSTLIGISTAPGVTGTKVNIQSNQVYSLTRTGTAGGATSQLIGIGGGAGTGTNIDSISGNTIYTLINPSSLVGVGNLSTVCAIYDYATATSGQYVFNNTIYDLENTYAGVNVINITAIALNGPATSVSPAYNICESNNIYIDGNCINGTTLTVGNIIGVDIESAAYDVVNNTIMLGDPTNNNTNPYTFSGIKKGAFAVINHIYFNSILIIGKVASGAVNTYCYNANGGTNEADLIKNNIFSNKRTNSGTASGSHYAMYFLAANVFDYNDYYANGTGGLLSNGNNSVPLSAGQDAHSLNVDPVLQYCNSTTPCPGTLYTLNHCQLGGVGLDLSTNTPAYTTDGFGYSPRAAPPDIGANEFTTPYSSAVAITPTSATINKCTPIAVQLTAIGYCSPVTYAWSPAGGLSATNISNPTANPTVTTTYTVVATSSTSATSSATVVITVGPYIEIGGASVCAGSTTAVLPYDELIGGPNQYSITWSNAATAAGLANVTNATLNLTATTSGLGIPAINFTVPGTLTSGNVYSGTFYVKNSASGCSSGGYAFTLTVVSGAPPNANLTFIQSPSPAHVGDNVTLTVTNDGGSTPAGTDWEWIPIDITGFSGYGTITNSLSNITLPDLNPITYDGTSVRGPGNIWWIVFEENACGIMSDQGPLKYSQVVPVSTFTNPSSCGSTDGSISFPGTGISESFYVTYYKNGVKQTPLTGLTSNGSGLLTISSLGSGTYTNIELFANTGYADSSAKVGPITLTGPSCAPTAYNVTGNGVAGASNCGSIDVGVANSQTGVTYQLILNGTNVSGSTLSGTNSAIDFGTQSTTGTYTVKGTDGSGNTTLMTSSATVNVVPTVNSITNQTVCNSGPTTAVTFGGTGTSYTWTNTATSIGLAASGSGNISSFTATNSGITSVVGTISVTPHNALCGGTAGSFTITVNPTPTVNSVTSQTVCNSASTTAINFTGAVTGTVYSWSNSTTSIGLAASSTGNISSFTANNSGTTPVTGTVTVTPQYTNNSVTCNGSTITPTITVNPTPTVNSVTNQTVCNSAPTTAINFTGAVAGTVYSWSNSTTSIGLAGSSTGNISSFTANNAGTTPVTGTITVTPQYTNNSVACNGSTITPTVTVNPTPTVNSVTNQTVCNSTPTTTINFTGAVAGTVYSWSNNTTSIGLAASNTGNISSFTGNNSGTTPVTGTITVTPQYTNNSVTCNGSTITPTITVNPIPAVTATPSNPTICSATGANIGLSNNTTGGTNSWTWTGGNGTNISGAVNSSGSPINQTLTNSDVVPQTATYVITPTFTNNSVGCNGSTITQTVTINPLPAVTATPSNPSICSLIGPNIGLSNNTSGGTNTWTWTGSNGTNISGATNSSGTPINQTLANSSNSVNGTATYVVTPVFTNNSVSCNGTPATQTVTVLPLPAVSITPTDAVCTGTTNVTLTANGNSSGYTWAPSTFLNTSTGNSVTAQISVLTFYTLTGTASNGCTANSNIVPVATVPSGGAVTPVATVLCSNTTTTLTCSGAAGHDYQWQISSDDINWSDISGATSTTYVTHSGDATAKKYYRLLAESDACWNVPSTNAIVDVSVTPTVTITNVTSSSATITWSPFASGEYNISWTGAAGSGSANAVTSSSYTIGSLSSNKSLSITVTPVTPPTCSGVNPATVSTTTLCAVPTILNLSAAPSPSHAFKVIWTPVPGASSYRIFYRGLLTNTSWIFVDTAGTQKTFAVPYAETYAVYIVAKDCPVSGDFSEGTPIQYIVTNPASACTPAPVVTAVSNCPNQISVSVSNDGTGPYAITFRRISPTITAGSTSTITGNSLNMTVGTQYAGSTWEVFARSICGAGSASDISNIAIVTIKPACPAVGNLVLSHPTCQGFTAAWNTNDCSGLGVSNYQLLIKKNGSLNYNGYPEGVTDHAVVNWLSAGVKVNVVVEASSCNGSASAYSVEDTITLPSCRTEETPASQENNVTGNANESVLIYPNPAQDNFFIDIGRTDGSEAPVKIELLNLLGQVMQTNISNISGGHLTESMSSASGMPSGIYFVRTTVGENVYTSRLMISKE